MSKGDWTMNRRILVAVTAATAAALIPVAASADTCSNVSRAPAACGFTCSGPVIVGNWVWLPSIPGYGGPAVWGKAPPGAPESVAFGFPGANGNYQNTRVTGNQSMLDNSATCTKPPGSNNRQTTNGIQTGCL
jgi:hypothetical protein